jgi:TPR repeat protein
MNITTSRIWALIVLLSLPAWANQELLKDEKPEKEMLVASPIPDLKEKCACAEPHKEKALAGDPKSIELVAQCFSKADKTACPMEEENYAKWVMAAATRGRLRSQVGLAYLYTFGVGVKVDHAAAADWYAQAARQNLPGGYFMLGNSYESGAGRKQSNEKALELYKIALKGGYEEARERVKELSEAAPKKP